MEKSIHNFYFTSGSVKNIYGNGDNYFAKFKNSDIHFSDFTEITVTEFSSLYLDLLEKAHYSDKGMKLGILFDV